MKQMADFTTKHTSIFYLLEKINEWIGSNLVRCIVAMLKGVNCVQDRGMCLVVKLKFNYFCFLHWVEITCFTPYSIQNCRD